MAIVKRDSGCKVGWIYFDNEEEARAYSPTAYAEGQRGLEQGYDYGYQMPGEVLKVWPDGKDGAPAWRVTTR